MRNVIQISQRAWEESGRRPNFLLAPGTALDNALLILKTEPDSVTGSLRDYILLSETAARRRRTVRYRYGAAVVAVAALMAAAWFYWANYPGMPLLAPIALARPAVAMAFSGDGAMLGVLSVEGVARTYSVSSGEAASRPMPHSGASMLAFNPHGTLVLTAGRDSSVCVWDSAGTQVLKPLQHGGPVTTACFSPDGQTILTASQDKTVRLWNTGNGNPRVVPIQHPAEVIGATYSRDGRLMASIAGDKVARVWDCATGEPAGPAMPHGQDLRSATFNADGTRLVTVTTLGTATIWEIPSGRKVRELSESVAVALSADGRRLVAGDRLGAEVCDIASGRAIARRIPREGGVSVVAISPDGSSIFIGARLAQGQTWSLAGATEGEPPVTETELPAPELLAEHDYPPGAMLQYATFAPGGNRVLVIMTLSPGAVAEGSGMRAAEDVAEGVAMMRRTQGGMLGRGMRVASAHLVGTALFSPDGKIVVTSYFTEVVIRDGGAGPVR